MINNGIILILISVILTSLSQVLLKISTEKQYKSVIREYINFKVIFAYSMFFITMFLNILALKYISMKSIQVFMALSYFCVLILSRVILKEKITKSKLIGNIIIIIGVVVFNI